MNIVLIDGTKIECNTDELMELKEKGFLEFVAVNNEQSEPVYGKKALYKVRKMKKVKYKTLKHKHFTKYENRIIKEVWNTRKNHIRLTNNEYKKLEAALPGRTRKTIGARLFRMRHHKN